ncbi:MAG: EF-P lysine aminoacylase EpmA [Gemmatimonas sp.]
MTDRHPSPRQGPPWWDTRALAARRPRLDARARMRATIAGYFANEGFAEVETPALQVSPGMEVHLRAFATRLDEPFGLGARALYLHTSPEFAMKKLLAAGEQRIFQFARTYRNAERSATHHPEFTMLEWYRAGASWRDVAEDCRRFVVAAWDAVPREVRAAPMAWQGRACDPSQDWEYLSVADAFARHAAVDLVACLAPDPLNPDPALLRKAAVAAGHRLPDAGEWDDIFFHIFLAAVEPRLGTPVPTVLHDWPAAMAALAKISDADRRFAERFEVYVAGLELANGFTELTDVREQRARFEADQQRKQRLYGDHFPIDEEFLAALSVMPPAAGVALGFDRLVMLATGAERIEDVLWAPVAGG